MTFGLGKKTRLASFLSIVTESACGTMRQFGDWSITCPEPKELRTPIEGLKRRLPGLPLSSAANHDSTSPAPSHTLPEQRPTYFGLSNPPGQQCPPPIIPVEPAEPPAPHLPRFRALVLFRRLSSAHLHPGVMQASENLTAADVCSASSAPTCSQLDEYSVRTPYEFPDRSVHRTGMRTHRIVPGVIDPHNRQILGILFKAMEQTR